MTPEDQIINNNIDLAISKLKEAYYGFGVQKNRYTPIKNFWEAIAILKLCKKKENEKV
jgi:hypothetical protein